MLLCEPRNSGRYFNPRSLAGATHKIPLYCCLLPQFQSTLPCGSDLDFYWPSFAHLGISIHAPLRERPLAMQDDLVNMQFQSTLPCGSDNIVINGLSMICNFNPRSLAGATTKSHFIVVYCHNFNPRSLAGATMYGIPGMMGHFYFNPRSLAGATATLDN